MILPDFHGAARAIQWDAYRRPHVERGPFTQFDTDELICTIATWEPRPSLRRTYSNFNLRIVGTGDPDMPVFHSPDGTPLLKAWLHRRGLRALLVDLDSGHAVALGGYSYVNSRARWADAIPTNLRHRCSAYFPGVKTLPVGSPVYVSEPVEYTPAERKHIRATVAACKVWYAMEKDSPDVPKLWITREGLFTGKQLAGMDFAEMDAGMRAAVAVRGLKPEYVVTEFPYVMLAR
jgi:hypothetical protein